MIYVTKYYIKNKKEKIKQTKDEVEIMENIKKNITNNKRNRKYDKTKYF